jgi:hypothetical protein
MEKIMRIRFQTDVLRLYCGTEVLLSFGITAILFPIPWFLGIHSILFIVQHSHDREANVMFGNSHDFFHL